MQDLASKTTGDTLTADEWNEPTKEVQNVITTSGLALSGGDLSQLAKSVAQYVSTGTFAIDSGASDTYVVSPPATLLAPHTLSNGLKIRFVAAFANTGASTINAYGFGIKDITLEDGSPLTGGEISNNGISEMYYDSSADDFKIPQALIPDASESVKGIAQIATDAEVTTGTNDTKFVTPLKLANSSGLFAATTFKTADQSIASNTTLTNDSQMNNQIPLLANSVYSFRAFIALSEGKNGGFKGRLSVPGSGTLNLSVRASSVSTTTISNDGIQTTNYDFEFDDTELAVGATGINITGTLETDGTAGDLGYQWAQSVSDPAAQIQKEGSWLQATKIG